MCANNLKNTLKFNLTNLFILLPAEGKPAKTVTIQAKPISEQQKKRDSSDEKPTFRSVSDQKLSNLYV